MARAIRYVVFRGPCYLALSTLVAGAERPDGIILVAEAGRSLTQRDVEQVTGVPIVAVVRSSPDVARCIDAGLLVRVHRLGSFSVLAPAEDRL